VEQIICVLCNASNEQKAVFQGLQARFGQRTVGRTPKAKAAALALEHAHSPAVDPMKAIQMAIDPHLLKAVDKLARLRKTARPALIRTALEAELRRERVNDLEARHTSGYARQPAAPDEFDSWIDQPNW
jgi:predicted transcriptional regulator